MEPFIIKVQNPFVYEWIINNGHDFQGVYVKRV